MKIYANSILAIIVIQLTTLKKGNQNGNEFFTNCVVSTKSAPNARGSALLNGNVLYMNTFPASNVPPFCFTVMPPLALFACVQIHNIDQHNENIVHGCATITLNFATTILIKHFVGCVSISATGIQAVDSNHNVIYFPITDKPPEIELVTIDLKTNLSIVQ